MDYTIINRENMKEYNIYAGLGGSFGGARYLYTTLCESEDDAADEAYQAACEEYEDHSGFSGLPNWNDAVEAARNESSECDDEPDEDIVQEYYNSFVEDWIDYYCVLTEDDDIKEEDLIRNYVIDDNDSGETCSQE